jgi:choline dehydrogenase-like flavoprotein
VNRETLPEYDTIIIGSGPGGATCARELARAGQRVLIVEKGKAHHSLGHYWTALQVLEEHGLKRSQEGMVLLCAATTGGATVLYSGSAALPPPWLKDRYGIDLEPWLKEIKHETHVNHLPEALLGRASLQVMETANRLGYHWEPMPKFVDLQRFPEGCRCGTRTHLGCTCGAKWTARDYLHEALAAGATLRTETECTGFLVANGKARGVKARGKHGERQDYRSARVIVAAGGVGSALLLQRAGIDRVGEGCVVDPTVIVYGAGPVRGMWRDPPVAVVSWEFYDQGIRLGTLVEPRLLLAMNLARQGIPSVRLSLNYDQTVGILVKIKDTLSGSVNRDGTVSKPLTEVDHARLRQGIAVATDLLRGLGCPAGTISAGDIKGVHPSGTCRIGQVVNENLETAIDNLYVCDASVVPEALDRPTVMTIIGLGKRLCAQLGTGKRTGLS